MGDMLTQEEINALLGGDDSGEADPGTDLDMSALDEMLESVPDLAEADEPAPADDSASVAGAASASADTVDASEYQNALTADEQDVLGEIGNISMGTAATTLFTLLNGNKVLITTPKVTIRTWGTLSESYDRPCVGIKVNYTEGLTGSNILILKEHDVKIISDLMMGNAGDVPDTPEPVSDMQLSAIAEAMNQMVGSSSTSLSSIVNRKVDIDPPEAMSLNFGDSEFFTKTGFVKTDVLACVAFRMEIGDLIDSEITQIIPIDFAKEVVDQMMQDLIGGQEEEAAGAAPAAAGAPAPAAPGAAPAYAPPGADPNMTYAASPQQPYGAPPMGVPAPGMYAQPMYPTGNIAPNVNASPAQFQSLDIAELSQQKENIGIIMDVPLEVTVELGRTSRKIREILEFAPGTIVDLDKLAGEPIDILVNGKFVATGEVVVVDENFAIRVVDIVNVDKRI